MATASVSAGGEHTLFCKQSSRDGSSNTLYSAGACGLGWCRRHPINDALFELRKVHLGKKNNENAGGEPCRLFHASYYHNLAVGAQTGRLYSWGCGTFTDGGMDGVIPDLGQGSNATDLGELPKPVEGIPKTKDDPIIQLSGGAYHSIVLTKGGSIFSHLVPINLGNLDARPKILAMHLDYQLTQCQLQSKVSLRTKTSRELELGFTIR